MSIITHRPCNIDSKSQIFMLPSLVLKGRPGVPIRPPADPLQDFPAPVF